MIMIYNLLISKIKVLRHYLTDKRIKSTFARDPTKDQNGLSSLVQLAIPSLRN